MVSNSSIRSKRYPQWSGISDLITWLIESFGECKVGHIFALGKEIYWIMLSISISGSKQGTFIQN